MNYKTNVIWDATLVDLYFTGSDSKTRGALIAELCWSAIKITAGAPTVTTNKFIPAAIVHNAITGVNYQNTGTSASPTWTIMSTGGGLPSLANGSLWIGNASNVATAVALTGDVTVTNAGVTAIGAGKVATAMIANNAVDGTKIALASQVTGSVMYYNGIDWIQLAPGTNGQVLTLAGGVPTWA